MCFAGCERQPTCILVSYGFLKGQLRKLDMCRFHLREDLLGSSLSSGSIHICSVLAKAWGVLLSAGQPYQRSL
jgi:hypothetical protein